MEYRSFEITAISNRFLNESKASHSCAYRINSFQQKLLIKPFVTLKSYNTNCCSNRQLCKHTKTFPTQRFHLITLCNLTNHILICFINKESFEMYLLWLQCLKYVLCMKHWRHFICKWNNYSIKSLRLFLKHWINSIEMSIF